MPMAFNGLAGIPNPALGYYPQQVQQQPMTAAPQPMPSAPVKLGYDDAGGLHDKLDRLGAHLMIAGGNTQGGSLLLQDLQQKLAAQMAQSRQMGALQNQLALAQYKIDNRAPTALQQNYEYLKQVNPKLAESYLAAEANPMTLTQNPADGSLMFTPKGGIPGMSSSGPQTKTVNGTTYYFVNGEWYDNPEGK